MRLELPFNSPIVLILVLVVVVVVYAIASRVQLFSRQPPPRS
jgi:hypothetical protein